ncbi:hypothetical protein [Antrihabitans spumae]|uniref:TIGR04438 family Trp-rich protein n=1 Tax=Antrihabitans spumae TaxID=3373370 RepID=A0ABW7KGE8_9NOCA
MVGFALFVIMFAIAALFRLADLLFRYWYIVVPIAVIVWIWLLGFEFGPKHEESIRRDLNAIAKRLPFSIRKRLRPSWIRWIERGDPRARSRRT